MRGATSPAGLLTALVVAAVALLVTLLSVERSQSAAVDPESRRALAEAVASLRALPPGSPLLAATGGERSFAGELGVGSRFLTEWTVQPLRWDPTRKRFVAGSGPEGHELARVTVRVRRRRPAGGLPEVPAGSRTFLLAGPFPGAP